MPLFSRGKKTILVGLAIHQDRISMVKLSQSRQLKTLEAFAITDLPSGSEELICIINKLVSEFQLVNAYTVIGLAASNVIHKRIRVATYLSEAERFADVFCNLSHYFPGIDEALNVDFVCMGKEKEEDDLLLVAARREQINSLVVIAEQAKLKVRVVDVDVYAILRAMALIPASEPMVVLDVDVSTAQLILISHGIASSVHPIPMSHDNDNLIQQLKRGISLIAASLPSSQIKKIILTGKKTCLDKIKQLLRDELQVHAEMSEVFKQVNLSAKINSQLLHLQEPELITAFGLVLRSFPQW